LQLLAVIRQCNILKLRGRLELNLTIVKALEIKFLPLAGALMNIAFMTQISRIKGCTAK
jgi:hypothetical protein